MSTNDDIKYCTHCGSLNKQSATVCCECENKINTRYFAFFDYLKGNIKDDLKQQVTDNVYSIIKNFLLSHIYGIILSVSIVLSGITLAAYGQPKAIVADSPEDHIEQVSINEEKASEKNTPSELTEDRRQWMIENAYYSYDYYIDHVMGAERHDAETNPPPSIDQLLAEQAIPDFPYKGVHEVQVQGFVSDSHTLLASYFFSDEIIRRGEEMKTDIAKKMYDDGYDVFEMSMYEYAYTQSPDIDDETFFSDPFNPAYTPDGKTVYNIVFVIENDKVYLVEEKLIERS